MVPTDNKTADRWLQRFPNGTAFVLLGVMVVAVIVGTIFLVMAKPGAGGSTQPAHSQPTATQPQ